MSKLTFYDEVVVYIVGFLSSHAYESQMHCNRTRPRFLSTTTYSSSCHSHNFAYQLFHAVSIVPCRAFMHDNLRLVRCYSTSSSRHLIYHCSLAHTSWRHGGNGGELGMVLTPQNDRVSVPHRACPCANYHVSSVLPFTNHSIFPSQIRNTPF